jgi:hypothetical protein
MVRKGYTVGVVVVVWPEPEGVIDTGVSARSAYLSVGFY